MHTKSKKSLISIIAIILLITFSLLFISCSKNKPYADSIPDSPVFQNIVEFVKKHDDDNTTSLKDYDKTYTFAFNPVQNDMYQYDICYSSSKNKLAILCNEYYINQLTFEKSPDEDYATTPTKMSGMAVLKIKEQKSQNDTNARSFIQYSFTFTITLQPIKLVDMNTTLTLPDFDSITKKEGSNANAPTLEPSPEEKLLVKQELVKAYNKYFNAFNQFYIEKIQNNDTRYNGAIFKYFYLPVMLKI